MGTISATKARQNFFKLIDKVCIPGNSMAITVDGEAKIVMMPSGDFDGWQETLEIIGDKKLMKGIKNGLDDLHNGKTIDAKAAKQALNL